MLVSKPPDRFHAAIPFVPSLLILRGKCASVAGLGLPVYATSAPIEFFRLFALLNTSSSAASSSPLPLVDASPDGHHRGGHELPALAERLR